MNNYSDRFFDFLRLALFVILLPIILLVIGPILVVAAVFQNLSLGSIRLSPGRHHTWGRAWAFVIGAIVWLVTWSGIAFVLPDNLIVADVVPTKTYAVSTQTYVKTTYVAISTPTHKQIVIYTPFPLATSTLLLPTPISTPTKIHHFR